MTEISSRFDPKLFDLLPHRPPMLLINKVVDIDNKHAEAIVMIDKDTAFFKPEHGVPSWIGLEYMGQTAALIAGYQLQQGLIEAHLGFLLGTRRYQVTQDYFTPNKKLHIFCQEQAVVGDNLATFSCRIRYAQSQNDIAQASLSVLRKPLNS